GVVELPAGELDRLLGVVGDAEAVVDARQVVAGDDVAGVHRARRAGLLVQPRRRDVDEPAQAHVVDGAVGVRGARRLPGAGAGARLAGQPRLGLGGDVERL